MGRQTGELAVRSFFGCREQPLKLVDCCVALSLNRDQDRIKCLFIYLLRAATYILVAQVLGITTFTSNLGG
jgi:hypothetical protein